MIINKLELQIKSLLKKKKKNLISSFSSRRNRRRKIMKSREGLVKAKKINGRINIRISWLMMDILTTPKIKRRNKMMMTMMKAMHLTKNSLKRTHS